MSDIELFTIAGVRPERKKSALGRPWFIGKLRKSVRNDFSDKTSK